MRRAGHYMIRAFRSDDLPKLMAIADRAWAPICAEQRRQLGDAALLADPATAKGLQEQAARRWASAPSSSIR